MNRKNRLKTLLRDGFFASQIPPCFSSASFAQKSAELSLQWDKIHKSKCLEEAAYERFSVARVGHNRRPIAIVNPVPQLYLSRYIAENWVQIKKLLTKSKVSLSVPEISTQTGRAIAITPVKDLHEARLLRSSGMRFALHTDISQFFPSIYTHAISWATEGKAKAKTKIARNDKNLLGNRLDELCRLTQRNQTIGIPIGPDTSHIISELIGGAVDQIVRGKLGKWPNGLRYVDDYSFYFSTESAATKALATLADALTEFELKLNIQKTKIVKIPEIGVESWIYNFDTFDFSQHRGIQRDDLHRFFDLAFGLARRFDDENVMQYALRRVETEIIKSKNWDVFSVYLMRCMDSFPNTIPECVTIVDTYHRSLQARDFPKSQWQTFLSAQLEHHAPLERHSEVAWLLWLALRLGVQIERHAVKSIEQTRSSVCLCIALHLEKNGQLKKPLAKKRLPPVSTEAELFNESWLLMYESAVQGWIAAAKPAVQSNRYFRHMLASGVSFFEPNRSPSLIFSLKGGDAGRLAHLLDSDDDVHEFFEFVDTRADYLGRRRRENDEDEDDEAQNDEGDDDLVPW